MNIKQFSGDFTKIGKQQGSIYKKNGLTFWHKKIDKTIYKNQLQIYKKYYPELLIEFESMAKEMNFDKDVLTYNFICNELIWYKSVFKPKACTIFGITNKLGTFIGRNYDWWPKTENYFQIYKITNSKRNSFIAISDMAYGGEAGNAKKNLYYNADDAINDKGLFIGLTFACNDKWNYGLSCIHMIKLIAETCSTVEDAIKTFKKIPVCCPKNYFIADKKGNMVVIEHTSKRFKILYPKNNVLIQTNNYVDAELAKEDIVLDKWPGHNIFIRYYETLQKINLIKNEFKLNSIEKVLNNKKSYTLQNNKMMATIWTLALDMKKGKYEIYWDLLKKKKKLILKI